MIEFKFQVFGVGRLFRERRLVDSGFVKAETWQEARETVQAQYPGLVVSVHSLDVYREATKHLRERGNDEAV